MIRIVFNALRAWSKYDKRVYLHKIVAQHAFKPIIVPGARLTKT